MTFDDLELREELRRSILELGHTQPTPIQEQAIPMVLAGHDLMCCAQTGTGKTAAFALPILERLASQPRAAVRAVILVPTRELAIQVGKSLMEYGKHLDIVAATIFGGVPYEPQEMMLRHGADILVATPGRLKDHIWRGNIDFRHTQFLVLDEADRMLDMGFIKAVREIVELMPTDRQSMLFSATLDSEIQRFSKGMLRNPQRIDVTPPGRTLDEVDQFLVDTRPSEKRAKLESLIRKYRMERTLVFARTKSGASRLASQLRSRGHSATAIHGDRSQVDRVRALEGFRGGKVKILVATDIAARGIDIDDISHVINYDLPYSSKDYVHRIGRTARAGRRGVAISLVTPEDTRGIAAIERLISRKLTWDDDSKNNNARPRQGSSTRRTEDSRSRRNGGRPSRERNENRALRSSAPRRGTAQAPARSGDDKPRPSGQRRTRRTAEGRSSGRRLAPDSVRPDRTSTESLKSRRPSEQPREDKKRTCAEPREGGVFRRMLRRLVPQDSSK